MQVGRLGASLVLRHLSPSAESTLSLPSHHRHTRLLCIHNLRFNQR